MCFTMITYCSKKNTSIQRGRSLYKVGKLKNLSNLPVKRGPHYIFLTQKLRICSKELTWAENRRKRKKNKVKSKVTWYGSNTLNLLYFYFLICDGVKNQFPRTKNVSFSQIFFGRIPKLAPRNVMWPFQFFLVLISGVFFFFFAGAKCLDSADKRLDKPVNKMIFWAKKRIQ